MKIEALELVVDKGAAVPIVLVTANVYQRLMTPTQARLAAEALLTAANRAEQGLPYSEEVGR